MVKVKSKPFSLLVSGLKELNKKCTVIESSCGGLINASIMAVPGSSKVFNGGSVVYNTNQSLKLLMNDSKLHSELVSYSSSSKEIMQQDDLTEDEAADAYIQAKLHWTEKTALAFCSQMDVDFAIAEAGAAGPTFRPKGMDKGFTVIAIAGRQRETETGSSSSSKVELLAQTVVHSTHANRQANMRFFADAAATLAAETIGAIEKSVVDPARKSETKIGDDFLINTWLDRATGLRSKDDIMNELERRHVVKYIALRNGNECLFQSSSTDGTTSLAILDSLDDHHVPKGRKTFLGLIRPMEEHVSSTVSHTVDGRSIPLFGIDVDETYPDVDGTVFLNTRSHGPLLKSSMERQLAWYATAMSQWKRTHKFCSSCGSPLQPIHGGTCLKCSNQECSSPLSWPRQDPSIIVLVTNRNGDKALLARSPRHPAKVHTALAGFVEAGEQFEDAVVREALEETGVLVDRDSITYVASQPWPFPRSTMIAFRATADDDINTMPIQIDTDELVSAAWFDKEDVMAASKVPGAVMDHAIAEQALSRNPSLRLLIPPKGVVARTLVDHWLEDQ